MASKPPSPSSNNGVDHRAIGSEQKLFFTHDTSPGTPFILPHGMRVATKVERVIRDLYRRWGYDEVLTPQIFKSSLWKQSGHWDNYRDDMFAVEGFKEMQERVAKAIQGERTSCCGDVAHGFEELNASTSTGEDTSAFGLKPMNCPGHCVMYNAQEHSYRDLPIRYAEFSPLHRNEASGALTGLTRVRRFHQDDAHVFCRVDQIFDEIASMLVMLRDAYGLFGFQTFELVLSTRPDQYLGELQDWDRAEDALRQALQDSGLPWSVNEADGAFYGPKIDIRLIDSAGKHHQTATVQLDFQLPRRFGLWYMSSSGERETPVMIHRAILGSVERFLAILMESMAGRWPFWLSPRQAVVLPTVPDDEALLRYAHEVRDRLALGVVLHNRKRQSGSEIGDIAADAVAHLRHRREQHTFHVEVDASDDKLGKRVRRAHMDKVNFTCVVGPKEMQSGSVQVRSRDVDGEVDGLKPVLKQDMGSYQIEDLRQLFITLDDHHW